MLIKILKFKTQVPDKSSHEILPGGEVHEHLHRPINAFRISYSGDILLQHWKAVKSQRVHHRTPPDNLMIVTYEIRKISLWRQGGWKFISVKNFGNLEVERTQNIIFKFFKSFTNSFSNHFYCELVEVLTKIVGKRIRTISDLLSKFESVDFHWFSVTLFSRFHSVKIHWESMRNHWNFQ